MMTHQVTHNQTDTPQARLSLVRCGRIRSCDWPITCCLAAANDGSSSYDSKRPAVHPAGRWISEGARLVRNVNGRGGRCRAWASVPAKRITSYSQARASEPVDGYRGRSRGDATIRTAHMARAVAVRCGGPGGQFLARLDRVISRRGFSAGEGPRTHGLLRPGQAAWRQRPQASWLPAPRTTKKLAPFPGRLLTPIWPP